MVKTSGDPLARWTCSRCGHQSMEYIPMSPANWLRLGAIVRHRNETQIGKELATLCGECAEEFLITFLGQGVRLNA